MKVLIVNTYDISGGAARAAYRLHQALQSEGVESHMLVQSKKSDDPTVIGSKTTMQKAICLLFPMLDVLPLRYYKNKTQTFFSPSWLPLGRIVDKINASNADVVHLHWIAAGMMSIEDIARIKKPIVWSLHDMWAFTGGCHYDEECGKYKYECCSCPVLGSKKVNDLSRSVFARKQRVFDKIGNLTIVGLSRWLADCASQSILFANKRVVNLPNPIDTTKFIPVNKVQSRMALNLPTDKKLVLYGAMSATSDPRKGYIELVKALGALPNSADTELLVFGSSRRDNAPKYDFVAHYLGHVDDDSLHLLYCAADVMVVPSLQENLSNAIMESLACGTPVVSFSIGGNRDLINHKQNGYLAEPFSSTDLAEGIRWVLNSPNYEALSKNAREKVLRCFDSKVVAKRYIELYESVIK
ncbi:MAG: glycosyltransferase family 4 protein [Methanosarcina sp.]|nr:glycosyltransferase family 4 protein [Methanosarcina sp.]MDD4521504.1 glycosyltransferase family 4 protein [Methanosarcina sp.]